MTISIDVMPSELNQNLLTKLKEFIKIGSGARITINIKEEEDYEKVLHRSWEDAEADRNMVNFTAEEFLAYKPAKK